MTDLDQALSDLRAAHVEIAGLKAKLAAVTKHHDEQTEFWYNRNNDQVQAISTALARVEILEKDKALWDGIETQKAKISYVFYDQETGICSIYGHDPLSSSGGKCIGSGTTLKAAIASALSGE